MTATPVAKNVAGGFARRTLFEAFDLTVARVMWSALWAPKMPVRARCCGY
ncbi:MULTISPECIES: hypothetical protein [unclassified Mycobacteroides]|nr:MULTISPECIES: hypothetical protein [unclassified Mycobacteroides]